MEDQLVARADCGCEIRRTRADVQDRTMVLCGKHTPLDEKERAELEHLRSQASILSASTLDEALEMQVWERGWNAASERLLDVHKRVLALEKLLQRAHELLANAENFKDTLVCEHEHCMEKKHVYPAMLHEGIGDPAWREHAKKWFTRWDWYNAQPVVDGKYEHPHDGMCESEFIVEAGAWTPCRCVQRTMMLCDRCKGRNGQHEVFNCQGTFHELRKR